MAAKRLTPAMHKAQIEAYRKEYGHYETYAATLKRVLEEACRWSFPEALVQARPKSLSSFAEKAARKFEKYPNAVKQMTDLCGGRVIVQTLDQVRAVRRFIEANFEILEREDKGLLLSENQFGYRDMHYIVRLSREKDAALGISPAERRAIGRRRAEIQVRTWLQHAWADTLHDRIYKNKLTISPEVLRTGNLLAALMEDADRGFNEMADGVDGLIANYAASAGKDKVEKEIAVRELILRNEESARKRAELSLGLARLVATKGDYARVISLLGAGAKKIGGAMRCEYLLELGHAYCRQHRRSPGGAGYRRGLAMLEEGVALCECGETAYVPHLRKQESLHARALARRGWALEAVRGQEKAARESWQRAHEHEPANPYYLASMLGIEMNRGDAANVPETMRTTIRQAIKTCLEHARGGIELPNAYFVAGRLSLLLGRAEDALGYYARGIWHCRNGAFCVPADALQVEIDWLTMVWYGRGLPRAYVNAIELLSLAAMESGKGRAAGAPSRGPMLIVAGGADSMGRGDLARVRPLLEAALAEFRGTVVAGGTTSGVPGCVGDVLARLPRDKRKRLRLVGYLPESLPTGLTPHGEYDELVPAGGQLGPEQILKNWRDVLESGLDPGSILLLGLGGGPISAAEYRIALALGASAGVVSGTGGTADALIVDPLWSSLPNLYPLPNDPMTVRAFVCPEEPTLAPEVLEEMAREFHAGYVASSVGALPERLKPWDNLCDDYKAANLGQAAWAIRILKAAGFEVRKAARPVVFKASEFRPDEIEWMAMMEHGRWCAERLRSGWRPGARDDKAKRHNCLVPWKDLPKGRKGVRKYDRDAVRAFPEILAKAKLEVRRAGARRNRRSRARSVK